MYIVNFVFIFFNSQVRSISQSKSKSKRAKNANKIITNKKKVKRAKKIKVKARETKVKTRETKVKAKTTRKSTKVNAKANATTTTTIATTTTNKKRLLRLCKQFACTYISFVFKTTLILLLHICFRIKSFCCIFLNSKLRY